MADEQVSQVRRVIVEPVTGIPVLVLVPVDDDAVLNAALLDRAVDPYAHTLWPAGLAAAAVLARVAAPGITVLDVGAGSGIAALTAAKLGARAVALDHDVSALDRIRAAAALQQLAVDARPFDMAGTVPLPPADVAVFSDVLYEPALARSAAGRVLEARAAGMHVIVADPGRAGRAVFSTILTARGFRVAFTNVTVHPPGEAAVTVGILELR